MLSAFTRIQVPVCAAQKERARCYPDLARVKSQRLIAAATEFATIATLTVATIIVAIAAEK
jgi:hypothetical protein